MENLALSQRKIIPVLHLTVQIWMRRESCEIIISDKMYLERKTKKFIIICVAIECFTDKKSRQTQCQLNDTEILVINWR